jgi:hypothetical protein
MTTFTINNDAEALTALASIMDYCHAQSEQIHYRFGTIDDTWIRFRRYIDACNKLFSAQHLLAGERDESIREGLEQEVRNFNAHQELERLQGLKYMTYNPTVDWIKALDEYHSREHFRVEQEQQRRKAYEKLCELTDIYDVPFNPNLDYITVIGDCLEMPEEMCQNRETIIALLRGNTKGEV